MQERHFEPVDVHALGIAAGGRGPAEEHFFELLMVCRAEFDHPVEYRIVECIIFLCVRIVRTLGIIYGTHGVAGITPLDPGSESVLVVSGWFGVEISPDLDAKSIDVR